MMEGIEQCINQIDEQVMQTLAPRIIHIIKKGTGLPTKVYIYKAGLARSYDIQLTIMKFIGWLCKIYRDAVHEPATGL